MNRIFLVRHAEPSAAWGDEADPGLSELGERQARAAAGVLAAFGSLDAVSSPMRRCRETAVAFTPAPRLEARVSEVAAPAGAGDRRLWLRETFPWTPGTPRRLWREVIPELRAWRDAAVTAVSELGRDTVVFTHFIAINAIVGAALGADETIVCTPGHASITELETTAGGLRLVRAGADMQTDDVR